MNLNVTVKDIAEALAEAEIIIRFRGKEFIFACDRTRAAADERTGPPESEHQKQVVLDVCDLCIEAGWSVDIDRKSSRWICDGLAKMPDRPWAKWRRGLSISPTQLARLLRPLGIAPVSLRFMGKKCKGYYTAPLFQWRARGSSRDPGDAH